MFHSLGQPLTFAYWKEEIASVPKGRGIMQFTQCADLIRTGRRFPLQPAQRETVWRLYLAYSEELRRRGVDDFADLTLLAEAELRHEPLPGYSAVIVDEAQDLSAAMVRMLYSLVGDRPDGFTLIGDGQQSIYPGGYTPAEVGFSVQNRGVVLDVNYRIRSVTREIGTGTGDVAVLCATKRRATNALRPRSPPRACPPSRWRTTPVRLWTRSRLGPSRFAV